MKEKIRLLIMNEDGLYEPILYILIIVSVIYAGISFYAPIVVYRDVVYMCDRIVTELEEVCEIDDELDNLIDELKEGKTTNPSVSYEGNFIYTSRGTQAIQLREPFYVTVSTTVRIKLFDPIFADAFYLEMPIKKRLKGVGQVYWRPSEL